MRGKFPGIPVCSWSYNLFGDNLQRGNAKRKEKSWLRGLPFYKFKSRIVAEDGTVSYQWSRRLVMEYAAGFNAINNENIADEQGHITSSPETELSGIGESQDSDGSNG